MKSIIIGSGEVGMALFEVLAEAHHPLIIDKKPVEIKESIDVMHICFPYSEEFIQIVHSYQKQYQPQFTVIHSTVPVGTSVKCAAYHSPIRGVHPNLAKGIKTFVKYLGPKNFALRDYFEKAGIKIQLVKLAKIAEAIKLWDTTYYGWNIAFEKSAHSWCEDNGIEFDMVYTDANKTYNEGYTELGMANVVRPVLKHMDDKIGGHCVMPNVELFDSPICDFIKEYNETL